MTGKVKAILTDRRFGFVTTADGQDWFFHAGAVDGGNEAFLKLREYYPVEFDGDPTSPRGPRITRLTPAA